MINGDEHDGRRTAAALLGAAVIGIAAVGAAYWQFSGMASSPTIAASQSVVATPNSTDTTIPDVPTTSATTMVVPSPTLVPFTPSPVNVAPAELPTMTAPAGASGDPTAAPTSPPSALGPPATVPTISEVSMFCHKNGDRVEGGLSFRTTTAVSVSLVAGGKVEQQSGVGPGVVSVTAAGKRGSYCMATVGSQRFGPMSAT